MKLLATLLIAATLSACGGSTETPEPTAPLNNAPVITTTDELGPFRGYWYCAYNGELIGFDDTEQLNLFDANSKLIITDIDNSNREWFVDWYIDADTLFVQFINDDTEYHEYTIDRNFLVSTEYICARTVDELYVESEIRNEQFLIEYNEMYGQEEVQTVAAVEPANNHPLFGDWFCYGTSTWEFDEYGFVTSFSDNNVANTHSEWFWLGGNDELTIGMRSLQFGGHHQEFRIIGEQMYSVSPWAGIEDEPACVR